MAASLLVVSPHPDDETLGAGGTLLKSVSLKHKVYWLNVTNMREDYGYSKEAVSVRNAEIGRVVKKYGLNDFFDLGLKPAGLDEVPIRTVISDMNKVISKIRPTTVILPYSNDIHSDHRIISRAGLACTKVFRHPSIKKILMMEVLSETDFSLSAESFSANYFIDISNFLEKKIDVMTIYKNELKKHYFPRSIKGIRAQAILRGAQAGCRYAEGFMLVKEMD